MISLIISKIPDRMPELPMFRDSTIDDDQRPEEVQKAFSASTPAIDDHQRPEEVQKTLSSSTTLGGSPTGVSHQHPDADSNNEHVQRLEHLNQRASHTSTSCSIPSPFIKLQRPKISDENASRLLRKLATTNGEVLEWSRPTNDRSVRLERKKRRWFSVSLSRSWSRILVQTPRECSVI